MNFITTSFSELIELGACDEGLQQLDSCMPPVYTDDTPINVLELPEFMLTNGFTWYVDTKAAKLRDVHSSSTRRLMSLLSRHPVFMELATMYYNLLVMDFQPSHMRIHTPMWRMALRCETVADAIVLLNALHQVFGDWETQ